MRRLLLFIAFIFFNQLISQEIVGLNDVYVENDLAYKVTDHQLFTGISQRRRKNGHLVYEEEFKDGIIITSKLYYNTKNKLISDKTIFNPNRPFVISKEHRFDLDGQIFRTITYNQEGLKILEEQFKNGHLILSSEYKGKKKHGFELGYRENEEILIYRCEYINGKKHGKEYCLDEDGTERIRRYHNGKRIK